MSNLGRIKPKYISVGISNDSTTLIDASIHIDWSNPTINKLDNYVVAIERMEVNLNCVPFYKANPDELGNEKILFKDRNGGANHELDRTIGSYTLATNYYSLFDLYEQLNAVIYTIIFPFGGSTTYSFNMQFGLDEIGRSTIDITTQKTIGNTFQNFYVVFPKYLNMILGFDVTNFDQANTNGGPGKWGGYTKSSYPQIDCGDNLNHIFLTSSLPVISDSIQVVQSNVLTDTCPPSDYTPSVSYPDKDRYLLSGSGWSLNTRQKFIYIPSERRFLDLIAPFNLRYLQVDCWYMSNDQTSRKVQLGPGGTFQIKLGFYQK